MLLAGACGSSESSQSSGTTTTSDAPTTEAPFVGTEAEQALAEAKELWRTSGFTSYSFVLVNNCFCSVEYTGPFSVDVTDGIVEVHFTDDQVEQEILSVTELFDLIGQELKSGSEVDVTYDELTGYPTSIFIDIDPQMADEEISLQINDLVGIIID